MLSALPQLEMQEGNRSFSLGTSLETAHKQLEEANSPAGPTLPTQGAGSQGRAHLRAPPMNAHQPGATRQTRQTRRQTIGSVLCQGAKNLRHQSYQHGFLPHLGGIWMDTLKFITVTQGVLS